MHFRILLRCLLFAFAPVTAWADAPLNYFLHADGPAARPTLLLDWVFTSISLAVCLIVAILLAVAMLRRRPEEDARAIGRGGQGLRWVGIGTGISTLILFGMAVYALVTLNQSAALPEHPALTITVTGYDWWWKAEYDDADPARRFVTANELHIPLGVPVLIELKSADVIHAFWVPKLAGKTQMIPGITNRQWLQADQRGIYRGQCTQFCGAQHAHMALEVVAQTPEDFQRWQDAQRANAALPATFETQQGQALFMQHCSACHTVRGSDATGMHAPDLTHIASRRLLAAGLMENTAENRMEWVRHAQELKPGSRMPDTALTPDQASALSAYLSTLK